MSKKELIQLFGEQKVRTKWDDEKQKWFFSIVDVCGVLTDSKDYLTARKYWNKLKQRLKDEGNETVTNCHQLKMMAADGKMRLTRRCQKETGGSDGSFCHFEGESIRLSATSRQNQRVARGNGRLTIVNASLQRAIAILISAQKSSMTGQGGWLR